MTAHKRAMLIPADPDKGISLFSYSNGLEDWKKIVNDSDPGHSGLFEVVAVPDFDAWFDEEFLFRAEPVVNTRAMVLLSQYGELVQYLYGDAIITGGADEEGNTLSLPAEVVAKVLAVTA